MSCPARVRIVSWNLWLIPFGGPWCLGRVQAIERCLCRHVGSMLADPGVEDCLGIAALQEAWAWRAGPLYPLVWLEAALQKRLLSSLFRGDREPLALRAIFALSRVVQLAGALVTSVCAPPLLRAVLWSPKPVLAASLRRAGLPHAAAAGESSFRHAGWPRQEPSVHRQPTCRSSFSVKVACPPAPRLPLERPRRPQPPTKGLTGGLNRQPDG